MASRRWPRAPASSSTSSRVTRVPRLRTSASLARRNAVRGALAPPSTLPLRRRRYDISGKEEKIEFEGEVVEAYGKGMYKIALDGGHETLGYTSGKMRRYRIRIVPGDRLKVELSSYALTRGRIVSRERNP